MSRPFINTGKLNLGRQLACLRAAFPNGHGEVRGRVLIWFETLTPTPLSRSYKLQLTYALGKHPAVRVVSPALEALAKGRKIPHLYSQHNAELCLYMPSWREWTSGTWLAHTIMPWSILWLYFFEGWLATGEWQGGGQHPR